MTYSGCKVFVKKSFLEDRMCYCVVLCYYLHSIVDPFLRLQVDALALVKTAEEVVKDFQSNDGLSCACGSGLHRLGLELNYDHFLKVR